MKKIALLISGLGLAVQTHAQFTNVLVGWQNDPEEVSIAINPKNTLQMAAGANIDNGYYSSDGGQSWTGINLTSTHGVWGDPCLFADTAGDFYFIHLSNPSGGNWIDRIVCQKSTNAGQTYNNGSFMGLNGTKAQDKAWAAVDFTNGPNRNNIYVTWTQFDNYGSNDPADSSQILFSRSTDAGATWSAPHRISDVAGDCIDSDNTVEGAVPCVGPNGEIYVSWAGPQGLMFDKSLDGGQTWLPHDQFVTSIPGGWDYFLSGLSRCNGLPVTTCDVSGGPHNGTIYINWTDQRNGFNNTDVWLVKSTDGGQTWTPPVKVNDDSSVRHQFLTWMCIDQATGYLYFTFYDRRNHNNDSTDVYLARSVDGGNTFTNYLVSQSPFLPDVSNFFGDYLNIAAFNNIVRPIWMRMDNGALSVYTALVDGSALGVQNPSGEYIPLELAQNCPNPFNESTLIAFTVQEQEFVTLYLYDIYGKRQEILLRHEEMAPGRHEYILNRKEQNLSPGVYFYSLQTAGRSVTKKMVLY